MVHISSRFGSLGFNQEPENRDLRISYSYRISKAAQNMLAVCLADELADEGISVDVVHPGSFISACGRKSATASAAETADRLVRWLDRPRPPGAPALTEPSGRM